MREGDGEEAAPLKFGEEVGKRGDESRLRLEFMTGEEEEEDAHTHSLWLQARRQLS